MARLRPFRALRFSREAGALEGLLAPPSAALASELRAALGRNPHHAVHLYPPPASGDDRSKYVRYAHAAAGLAQARRAGVLVPDGSPALYRVRTPEGAALVGLVRAGELAGPAARPKEEPLRLLEATRTYVELPLATCEGIEVGEGGEAAVERIPDDGRDLALRLVRGRETVEAALAFRASLGEREGEIGEDLVPVAVVAPGSPLAGGVGLPSGLAMWSLADFP